MTVAPGEHPDRLIRLAKSGSESALGQLLELYRHYLGLLAQIQAGKEFQAKVGKSDLVQETFLRAHHHFSQFRGSTENELLSWLRRILATTVANLTHRHYGRERRDIRRERRLTDELDQSSHMLEQRLVAVDSSPSAQAVRRERAVLFANALQDLRDDYRDVIVLRHLEGRSFAEVARQMGRSVDSVEKLWIRALDKLRRGLGDIS